VLRQTEEANLIVASSYNAVVKWILINSLFIYKCVETIYHLPKLEIIWQRHSPDYNIFKMAMVT